MCAVNLKYLDKIWNMLCSKHKWLCIFIDSSAFFGSYRKCKDGRPLSSRDRHNLQELEGKLQVLRRRGRHLEIAERNCCTKVGSALRPFKVSLHYGIGFPLKKKIMSNRDCIVYSGKSYQCVFKFNTFFGISRSGTHITPPHIVYLVKSCVI